MHSLKDLPTENPEELVLGAVPKREDVADALIAPVYRSLQALPAGSQIGTSSTGAAARNYCTYVPISRSPTSGATWRLD